MSTAPACLIVKDSTLNAILGAIISAGVALVCSYHFLRPNPSPGTPTELLGYCSAFYSGGTDRHADQYFIFIRHGGPEIKVDLYSTDLGIDDIRGFPQRLDTGQPLRDLGHLNR